MLLALTPTLDRHRTIIEPPLHPGKHVNKNKVNLGWCVWQLNSSKRRHWVQENKFRHKRETLCLILPLSKIINRVHNNIPAKPLLHNSDTVSVHFNHFYCMGICDKLSWHLYMLTYIYLNVDEPDIYLNVDELIDIF